jgi:cupin fold WbuC family metalloprotein
MAASTSYKKINILENSNLRDKIKIFKKSGKKFDRIVLHENEEDLIQIMVMMYRKSFNFPFHYSINKSESFSVIYGKFKILFKEKGKIRKIILDKKNKIIFKLNANVFHKIIPLSDVSVALEILDGPFKRNSVRKINE